MTDVRKVKIESVLDSQIPSFLNQESPLFKEFLKQYYISQTHPTGVVDIATNVNHYKNINTFTTEQYYTSLEKNKCYLIDDLSAFDDVIIANSTFGFPEKYGLLKIDNEIITYTGITNNSFTGCVRGFSGIEEITDETDLSGLIFSITNAAEHSAKSTVENLNLIFYSKLFEKFRYHYLPDFEKREFSSKVNLDLILSRARDFYLTKGTDISYKILFEILYNDKISIFRPKDFIFKTSSGSNFYNKNILVEPLFGEFTPNDLIGRTIFQAADEENEASASIYNIQFRPVEDISLYEISLDSESIIYNFSPTNKTYITEVVSNGIFVDSTIGFPDTGILYVKTRNDDLSFSFSTISYSGKTINKFLNITGVSLDSLKEGDELFEDKLAKVILDDESEVSFRLIPVIETFDFSNTRGLKVNDSISISTFGENFTENPEFKSWIYNYPTFHNIKSLDLISGSITFYSLIKFKKGEKILLIDEFNNSVEAEVNVINEDNNQIEVSPSILGQGNSKVKVKKTITKSPLNLEECAYVQNTYYDKANDRLIVASSGLPNYGQESTLNVYKFNLTKTSNNSVFSIRNNNRLLSGNKVYFNSKSQTEARSGEYFVKKITRNTISLYKSNTDLYLSYSNKASAIEIKSSNVGDITILGYENISEEFSNQLLLKEFKVKETLFQNQIVEEGEINSIEDAFNKFNP